MPRPAEHVLTYRRSCASPALPLGPGSLGALGPNGRGWLAWLLVCGCLAGLFPDCSRTHENVAELPRFSARSRGRTGRGRRATHQAAVRSASARRPRTSEPARARGGHRPDGEHRRKPRGQVARLDRHGQVRPGLCERGRAHAQAGARPGRGEAQGGGRDGAGPRATHHAGEGRRGEAARGDERGCAPPLSRAPALPASPPPVLRRPVTHARARAHHAPPSPCADRAGLRAPGW